jgi:hypothetical protein
MSGEPHKLPENAQVLPPNPYGANGLWDSDRGQWITITLPPPPPAIQTPPPNVGPPIRNWVALSKRFKQTSINRRARRIAESGNTTMGLTLTYLAQAIVDRDEPEMRAEYAKVLEIFATSGETITQPEHEEVLQVLQVAGFG